MSHFNFWQKWLLVVSVAIAGFGVLLACLSGTPLFDLFSRQIDPVFWGPGTPLQGLGPFQNWIYGLWGATIAGWGIFLTFIVHYPFRHKEKWAWNCLVLGLAVWFLLDTGLSLIYRVYFNVGFNTALLILAGLPVGFTRKEFA